MIPWEASEFVHIYTCNMMQGVIYNYNGNTHIMSYLAKGHYLLCIYKWKVHKKDVARTE